MTDTIARCATHGEPTRITCVDCGDPICPKCMVRTEVGLKCPEHGAPAAATAAPAALPAARPATYRWLLLGGAAVLAAVVVLVIVVLRNGGDSGSVAADPVGAWEALADLADVRGTATLVALPDGTALAAGGGVSAIALDASARFDPATGAWSAAGALVAARRGHAAVRLDDGRVLVSGGVADNELLATAEVFDPGAGTWQAAAAMGVPRLGHTLSLLPDGTVLAAGGTSVGAAGEGGGQAISPVPTTEVYDPVADAWRPGPDLSQARFEHTAITLEDGRVLVAGGFGPSPEPGLFVPAATAELYDAAAGVFVSAGAMADARANHGAAILGDGRVVVAGGAGGPAGDEALATAEVYDPRSNGWTGLPPMRQARTGATVTGLADGTVLVAGGEARTGGSRRSLTAAERLNLTAGVWLTAGDMACPRSEHAAAVLGDGSVLVVAGDAAFPGEPPVAQPCVDRYVP